MKQEIKRRLFAYYEPQYPYDKQKLNDKVIHECLVITKASDDFTKDYTSIQPGRRQMLTDNILDLWDKHIEYLACKTYDLYTMFDEPICVGDFVATLGIDSINLITEANEDLSKSIPVMRFYNQKDNQFNVYASFITKAKRKMIKLNESQIRSLVSKTPDLPDWPNVVTILKNRYGITV